MRNERVGEFDYLVDEALNKNGKQNIVPGEFDHIVDEALAPQKFTKTPKQILQDPVFHKLPDEEKVKVLDTVDPNFRLLPDSEKYRVFSNLGITNQGQSAGVSITNKTIPGVTQSPSQPFEQEIIYSNERPTGRVSTITDKPIMEYDPEAPEHPSFGTMFKSSLVDDQQTKINIFAKARGISPDRYFVANDGKIAFRDDNGVLRYEAESSTPTDKIKSLAATVAGNPSIPMATIGATAGPWTAAIGGAGGEAWRKVAGSVFFDEPQTALGNVLDLSSEGVLALLSEFGGRGVLKAVNKVLGVGKPKGRLLRKATGSEYQNLDLPDIERIRAKGKEFGIDLFSPQTTRSKELIDKMNFLRDLPQTSNIIQAADNLQNEQVQSAIPKFFDTISDPGATSRGVGERLKRVAESAVVGLKDDRAKITSPIYKAAFNENPAVDVNTAIGFIDDKLDFAKGDERRALQKLRKDILEPVSKREKPILFGPDDKPIPMGQETDNVSLRGIHGLKTSLDKKIMAIGRPGSKSIDNIIGGEMKVVRKMLIEAMDEASPTYRHARTMHAMLSPEVNAAEEGLTGILAKAAEGDGLVKLSGVLLASRYTRPSTVKAVRARILHQADGEEVWNQAIRDYLEYAFETIPESQIGSRTNFGGAFRKRILGTMQRRNIMKEALGDKYQNLADFMEVLERTGLTFKGESTTVTRGVMKENLEQETVPAAVRAAREPMKTPSIILFDKLRDYYYGRNAKVVAEALIDDRAATELARLKTLKPGSEKLIKGVTTFLEMGSAHEAENRFFQGQ